MLPPTFVGGRATSRQYQVSWREERPFPLHRLLTLGVWAGVAAEIMTPGRLLLSEFGRGSVGIGRHRTLGTT